MTNRPRAVKTRACMHLAMACDRELPGGPLVGFQPSPRRNRWNSGSMPNPPAAVCAQAVDRLGWAGDVAGPVDVFGVRFLAVVRIGEDPWDGEIPDLTVVGCLFTTGGVSALQREASLVAAYAPRAVLVPEGGAGLAAQVDAAILDQGLVSYDRSGEIRVLVPAGPRSWTGAVQPREERFIRSIRASLLPTRVSAARRSR